MIDLDHARRQALDALAGCSFCDRPHRDGGDYMHCPVPYTLTVVASDMLVLLDRLHALEAAVPDDPWVERYGIGVMVCGYCDSGGGTQPQHADDCPWAVWLAAKGGRG